MPACTRRCRARTSPQTGDPHGPQAARRPRRDRRHRSGSSASPSCSSCRWRDGYREATVGLHRLRRGDVLIGIPLGLLGHAPGFRSSRTDRRDRRVVEHRPRRRSRSCRGRSSSRPCRVPDHGDPGRGRGASNGVFPGWLVLAFFAGVRRDRGREHGWHRDRHRTCPVLVGRRRRAPARRLAFTSHRAATISPA